MEMCKSSMQGLFAAFISYFEANKPKFLTGCIGN